ncbi:MAG: cupin domain-containing protein [Kofleriaceae bacterium]
MATLYLRDTNETITDPAAIAAHLAPLGIQYERWAADRELGETPSTEEVLAAYAAPIAKLKEQGGYVTADVIDIKPDTPNLDAMLAKFKAEHFHDEDEVRFTLAGRGIFHLHLESGVVAVEVVPGDLLRVPSGTHHWFDLCGERRIRAIRLFQQTSGWAPHYTETGVDARYVPLCLGPAYIA